MARPGLAPVPSGYKNIAIAIVVLLVSTLAHAGEQKKTPERPVFRDGVVLVGFEKSTSPEQQSKILSEAGAKELRVVGEGVHVVSVPLGRVMQAIALLQKSAGVRYAEPDYRHSLNGAPNDPKYPQQWAFQNIGQSVNGVSGASGADEKALAAWNVTTGSPTVVVAVTDTGIDYNHPDLAPNVWSNPGGINGCPAGTHGYNVLNSTCDPMDDDTVYNGHGTHVAGIIGAAGNNAIGVTGVNWQTSLLALKWVDAGGHGYTSDLISALDWAIKAKQAGVNMRVVNDSQTWVGTAASQALSDEIDALGSNDILFVTAAGNTAQDDDTTPRYPCVYDRPNQICAAASDQNDQLWSSSNYGAQTVDLAAPGVNILSTLRNGTYGYISGCSMSAAQVSGAAALVLSTGYLPVAALKSALLGAVDKLPAFSSTTRTGGRLDVCSAMSGCSAGAPMNTSAPTVSGSATVGQTLTSSTGAWSGNPTSFAYAWQRCDATGTACSSIQGATSSSYSVASADVGSTLRSTVTAANSAGSTAASSAATSVVQSGGSSAITMVQKAAAQASYTGSVSVSFPGRNQAGNLIIAVVRYSTTTQTVTLSDTVSNKYVEAVSQVQTTDGHQIRIFYAPNIATGANTVTATFSASNNHPWLAIYEYSGLSTTYPLDRTASTQGSSAAPSSGATLQTRAATELLFGALALPSSSSAVVTAGTGYTLEQQDTASPGSRAATEDGVSSSIGTVAASYALSASTDWSAAVATFSTTPITSATPLAITTTSLPDGKVGTSYTATFSATGGTPPYSWTQSGGLPPGLSLSATGTISGTPSAAGSYKFVAQVTDASSATAMQAFTINVSSATGTPITLVQSSSAVGTGVSSLSKSFPAAITSGNLIIAFVRMSTTSQTVTVSDSLGNAYAAAVAQAQTSDGHQIYIFYAKNVKGGANTVTASFSSTNNHPFLAIYEFSGLSSTSPLDQVADAQGSSSTPSSGSTAITGSANELIFAALGVPSSSSVAVSPGSAFVLSQQDATATSSRAASEYSIVSATGNYAGTFTLSGTSNWSAALATFKQ